MISPMQQLDQFTREKLEEVKDTNGFNQFLETYSSLEDWQQDAIKAGMMFLSLFIPFVITFIFYLIYSSANAELALRENIIRKANQIIASSTDLRRQSNVLSPFPIGNQSALEGKFSSFGLDTTKLRIAPKTFDNIDLDGVNEMQATIEFKDMSTEDLNQTLKNLSLRAKFKFREILITKNEETNLLEGNLGISQYSKIRDGGDDT